jgi:2-oxoacid:acceptor oxidoreductase gamma subunit (pyruvate/2-ketoisovalerate family)
VRPLELRIHGRGGQGAQVACQILADAFFRAGAWVQAFAAYGGERRGAPVTASLRVDEAPIRLRCDVERPDHLIVLDPTLLAGLAAGVGGLDGLVLVNSPNVPCGRFTGSARVVAVDADTLADRLGLGPIVATAMAGAFAGATGLLPLEHLAAAVEAGSPAKKRENVEAAVLAYRAAAAMTAMEVQVTSALGDAAPLAWSEREEIAT